MALIKNFGIIQRVYRSFLGSMWLQYNEMLRILAFLNLISPWDKKETELWSEVVMQDQLAIG